MIVRARLFGKTPSTIQGPPCGPLEEYFIIKIHHDEQRLGTVLNLLVGQILGHLQSGHWATLPESDREYVQLECSRRKPQGS